MNDLMDIAGADGKPVAYHGRASRLAASLQEAYWTIAPGETRTSRIDLPANYDVEGSRYTVSYEQRYLEMSEFDPDGAPGHTSESNALSIHVNASLTSGKDRRGFK